MGTTFDFVWVFVGENARFPSGLFTDLQEARAWISKNGLTGVLTRYPMNTGTYDWAVSSGLFVPKKPEHTLPAFIGRFSAASMEHFHFENGVQE
jgi:hypothetical protein